MANNLQTAKQQTFSNFITQPAMKAKINEVIGGRDGNKFISSLVASVSANPELQKCDHGSLFSAALLGVSLKLSPSPQLGHFYMIPFNDKKANQKKANFILGYKGMIQLALRTGRYKKINVISIKEGELKSYDPLTEEIEVEIIKDDEVREASNTIGYYAFFETVNGFKKSAYWSKEKVMNHADRYSPAFNKEAYKKLLANQIPSKDLWKYSSFWYKDFDIMAYKTLLRDLFSKWGILSIDEQKAFESDEKVINEQMGVECEDITPQGGFDYNSSAPIEDIDNDNNVINVEKENVDIEKVLTELTQCKSIDELNEKIDYNRSTGVLEKMTAEQRAAYDNVYNELKTKL